MCAVFILPDLLGLVWPAAGPQEAPDVAQECSVIYIEPFQRALHSTEPLVMLCSVGLLCCTLFLQNTRSTVWNVQYGVLNTGYRNNSDYENCQKHVTLSNDFNRTFFKVMSKVSMVPKNKILWF